MICCWSLYLATELSTFSFASLNVTFFAAVPFWHIQGFREIWTVSQVIVTTATSVKKCFLLSTNFMYLNKKCWFILWAIRISLVAKSNDNSHSFFLWVVLLNLTIYWVRENNALIFRTQKSVNIKAELFGVELSTNTSMGAIHSTKISGNFGPTLNGSVRSNRKSFEKTGPPFEVVLFSRSDRSECWLNGSRPYVWLCLARPW